MPVTRSRTARLLVPVLVVGLTATGAVLGTRWVAAEFSPSRCVFTAAGEEVRLTPEQAANAGTIAAVSVQRGLPPRAATIALATAIQESKLRNLRYGHADSQGLFQQRPSQGWGTVEQITDPVYASNAFYDALVQVEGWQDGVVTQVAQEVQRSAFPEAYADHEQEGRVLASILTGQEGTGTDLRCRVHDGTAAGSAQAFADKALAQLGLQGQVEGRTVRLEAGDPARAWAAATWAVTHAEAEDVSSVAVEGRRWDRRPGDWSDDEAGGSAAGSVVVEVG
ncbi:hypothetical protein SGUI_2995 [Serinicoccus hydrothermalis]|uniref:Heavy metal transporter n=1 Tax=Serinicoccus hydrothermalis TaxID=1758689 RepID=A0A1B1NG54_9MICO|nr:hypothetical protein SGUI_2995 [Serinicoccus hydrothermalis]